MTPSLPRGAIVRSAPTGGPALLVVTPYDPHARARDWDWVCDEGLTLVVVPSAPGAPAVDAAQLRSGCLALPGVTRVYGGGLGAEAAPWLGGDHGADLAGLILQQPEPAARPAIPPPGVPTLVLGSWFCDSVGTAAALADAGADLVMGPWVNPYQQRLDARCAYHIDPERVPPPLELALRWLHGDERVGAATFVRGVDVWEPWSLAQVRGEDVVLRCPLRRTGATFSLDEAAWWGAAVVEFAAMGSPTPEGAGASSPTRRLVTLEHVRAEGTAVPLVQATGRDEVTLPDLAFRLPPGDRVRVVIDPPPTCAPTLRCRPLPPPPPARDPGLRQLVDNRTGVLTEVAEVEHWAGLPADAAVYSGQVADVQSILGWPADRLSMGMSADPEAAWHAVVGEAIERYCGNAVDPTLRRVSYAEVTASGELAVDPEALALFHPDQLAERGCPFVAFTRDLAVDWCLGYRLADQRPIWVPAALAWVNFLSGPDAAEHPAIAPPNLAGLAAGANLAEAERSALEEIIERDAAELWWACGRGARVVRCPGSVLGLGALEPAESGWWVRRTEDVHWRLRPLALPTTLQVSVAGVVLHDVDLDVWSLGLAARPQPAAALAKAALEAVSLNAYSRGLLDPDGDVWTAARTGLFDGTSLHRWRADRAYLQDYRPDFRDVTDLACHAQVWLDPAMARWAGPLTDDLPEVDLDDLPRVDGDVRAGYLQRLTEAGMSPVGVDLTTCDVRAAGPMRVVRVVAPGAYSNTPAGFRLLGGRRLYDDPVRLGWCAQVRREDLIPAPMPHT